jgi:predicted lipoprotein with Yx(FWY)xxD motif
MRDKLETAAPHGPSRRARFQGGAARRLIVAVVALAGVTFVAAVSSASVAAAATGTVDVGTSANFGTVLTNAQGFALYTFPSDVNGMSKCTGACAQVWPALTVPAATTPSAGSGVTGTVAAALQANGTYQVTYNGSPLYTFVGDTSAGQVAGNGVGGFAVVKVAAAPAPPTTGPPPTSAPTSVATPPSTPAPVSPTPSPTTASTGSAATASPAPAPGPATAAASGAPSSPASSAPTGATAAAPTTLAATGFGTGLQWLVALGMTLIALSIVLSLFFLDDKNRIGRDTVRTASRAGWWLLGR